MAIRVRLDVMLARRKVRSVELAQAVGITQANLSLLKSGKVRGVRFSTLEAICRHLQCQPGDLLEYEPDEEGEGEEGEQDGAVLDRRVRTREGPSQGPADG